MDPSQCLISFADSSINFFIQTTILGDCATHVFKGINICKLGTIYGYNWCRGIGVCCKFISLAETDCHDKQNESIKHQLPFGFAMRAQSSEEDLAEEELLKSLFRHWDEDQKCSNPDNIEYKLLPLELEFHETACTWKRGWKKLGLRHRLVLCHCWLQKTVMSPLKRTWLSIPSWNSWLSFTSLCGHLICSRTVQRAFLLIVSKAFTR